jgi:murein DD-endopeptidase MepM/ murein hydrolase activator NlpD
MNTKYMKQRITRRRHTTEGRDRLDDGILKIVGFEPPRLPIPDAGRFAGRANPFLRRGTRLRRAVSSHRSGSAGTGGPDGGEKRSFVLRMGKSGSGRLRRPLNPLGRLRAFLIRRGHRIVQILRNKRIASIVAIAAAVLIVSSAVVGVAAVSNPFPRGGVALPEDLIAKTLLYDFAYPSAADSGEDSKALLKLPQSLAVKEYIVRKGDGLSAIASRFGIGIGTLLSVNGIADARQIVTGTRLKIPNMNGITHQVKRGDTIGGIAHSYSVPMNAILDSNNLETDILRVGSVLFIPGASLSSTDLKRALGELFISPAYGRLSSGFGYRSDPFTGVRFYHNGIDLAAPTGTRVSAAIDGTVADVGYNLLYGNYVIISSPGYQTWYAHLSRTDVKVKQTVRQGQKIGEVGNTGHSTGSHLHFSIFQGQQPVNPLKYIY